MEKTSLEYQEPPLWKFLVALAAFFAVLVAVAVYVGSHKAFDSTIWAGVTQDTCEPRDAMLNDLLARYKLVGMTRNQVVQLLGASDLNDEPGRITYCLDVGWDVIDPDYTKWLEISFDESNVATSYRVKEWHKGELRRM